MHGLHGVLHGEGTVQTEQGQVRVAIQHGTVSQVSGSNVTVQSSDGFTRTWSVGSDTKVVSMRTGLQSGQIGMGSAVFVAGTVQGTGSSATYSATYILMHTMHGGGMKGSPEPSGPAPAS
ncbi:hypothetical protein ABT369_06285 [Dactylosporangium sp. NPDC000244]|uniref:hypothetical protein n=1 Tax=Dactylosporangium sp. NPDC000244 TaxID=3154365 RepID=UPI00332AF507